MVLHRNVAEETVDLKTEGARLLWGSTYEVKRSADGSLSRVTPYHFHTKREYMIIGISGEMRIIVEGQVHAIRPHDVLMIRAGEKHMEVDVGMKDFRVLMMGYDPPGEERVLVPYEETPAEIRAVIDAQPLRTPIPNLKACEKTT